MTVSRVATGTYCFTKGKILDSSVAGSVQNDLNGFQDLTMVVSFTVNTTASNEKWVVYTAKSGALSNHRFTLTFALAP